MYCPEGENAPLPTLSMQIIKDSVPSNGHLISSAMWQLLPSSSSPHCDLRRAAKSCLAHAPKRWRANPITYSNVCFPNLRLSSRPKGDVDVRNLCAQNLVLFKLGPV